MPKNENITGDPYEIAAGTEYLLGKLDEYLKEHNLRDVDVFMIAHNFHGFIVKDMAKRWENGVPQHTTIRMADLTFRKALRELR